MSQPYEFRGMIARADMVGALNRYAQMRVPVGGFLTALLSNDLKEAFARADDDNLHNMPALVAYCWNHLPSPCWGSPEKVAAWLAAIKAHDDAIDAYLKVRLNPKSTEADIQAARVAYDAACRKFEQEFDKRKSP